MFNCREVSRLVSESLDRELSLPQRLGIRFHLLMCRYCTRFARQLEKVRNLVRAVEADAVPPVNMDDKTKVRLKEYLRKYSGHEEQ